MPDLVFNPQDSEVSVFELQQILDSVISKRRKINLSGFIHIYFKSKFDLKLFNGLYWSFSKCI